MDRVRNEVKLFAKAMEKELKENDYKGGWKNCTPGFLFDKLSEEVAELRSEVYLNGMDKEGILSEAADVGNIAMMIADVSLALVGDERKCGEDVLKTEYSIEFDELCKNRMIVSFYKYGPIRENYGNKLVNAIENLEKRLELYKQTGNIEYLVDVANFARIEFEYPQHPEAHFENRSESPGLGGMTFRDIERL